MTSMTYVRYAAAAALTVDTLGACGGGDDQNNQASSAKGQASLEVYAELTSRG